MILAGLLLSLCASICATSADHESDLFDRYQVGGTVYANVKTTTTTMPEGIQPRGDDLLIMPDLWGDYKMHGGEWDELWGQYKHQEVYPPARMNDSVVDSPRDADQSWDDLHGDPKWAYEMYKASNFTYPPILNAPWNLDRAGYSIPDQFIFQRRKFNRAESTFAIKFWQFQIEDAQCASIAIDTCRGSESGAVFSMDNDRDVQDCLLGMPQECEVVITGFVNYTSPHMPELCCSNIFSMRLPSPGNFVPLEECVYGDVIVHNFSPRGGLRDNRLSNDDELNGDLYNEIGARKADPWNEIGCMNPVSEPYERGCQARAQFGNNLFTDGTTNSTLCKPPDFQRSMLIAAYEDYEFYPSEYNLTALQYHPQDGRIDFERYMLDLNKLNFVLRLEQLRSRSGDRSLRDFTMQISGFAHYNWCGQFTGVGVPMKCVTHGFKGFFSQQEKLQSLHHSIIDE